ncbi:MAG: glycosyltransferase [Phycisphaerae bacterium]|nr:glycosyltransferase [Phycisphaerae bacterium]MDW8262552.1 glycosyltransferase [Phycisphaerales bacterium]
MRILHVVGTIDPANGGPPLVTVRLASAQAGLGHEVSILTYVDPAAEERIAQSTARVPGFERVRRIALPRLTRGEHFFASRARRELAKIVPHCDFLHLHGVWERLLKTAAELAARHGVGYCFRPAGMLDPWSLNQSRWKKKLALAMGYRRVLSRASFLHALNSDEAQLMAPLKLSAPAVIIPNGVFLEEIEPLPAAGSFRAAFRQLENCPFVLFLARLHQKKGLDYLIEAFGLLAARRADVRLVLAGPDEGARGWLEREIDSRKLRERVLVTGGLYGQDKFAAMVDATVFCLPSRQEGFPVAAVEALACGLPVVISQNSHFPQIADAGAGFVVPLEPRKIADALERIVSDPLTRARMSEAGKQLVRQQYLWPDLARQTIEAYQQNRAPRAP